MSLFSLEWFKSERTKELEKLKVEGQALNNEIKRMSLNLLLHQEQKPDITATEQTTVPPGVELRVCKKIKLVGDTLTVVLNDGSVISKQGATSDDFMKARALTSEQELILLMTSATGVIEAKAAMEEVDKIRRIHVNIEKLAQLKDFELKDNVLYLTGTSRSIPEILVDEFLAVVDDYEIDSSMPERIERIEEALKTNDRYQALKNFFLWCCLNPRAEVADQLYAFLKKNSFRITRQGFFVALRNVVRIKGNDNGELVDFVSNSYNKIKAVWKRKPEDFTIYKRDGSYHFTNSKTLASMDGEFVGNLKDLYLDLPKMSGNRFTDAHTRTFDIRVGAPVWMDPAKCNWSTADCAHAGLHFTADEIHYVGCGDTSVLILINPMKVVGIGESKGRCYEYLPIMTVPRVEATQILHDLDFDTIELDEDYAIRELQGLTEKVKEGFVAETSKYQFNLPNISTVEITKIVKSLEDMKNVLSKRVSVIK